MPANNADETAAWRLTRPLITVPPTTFATGYAEGELAWPSSHTTARFRAAIIGLGRIYDLNVRGLQSPIPDVEVVRAGWNPSEERRAERQADWPKAGTFASAAELAASRQIEGSTRVEALLADPAAHRMAVIELFGYGWHVNLQKPMCNDLGEARQILDAAKGPTTGCWRIMENYLFYEPFAQSSRRSPSLANSARSPATT